MLGEAEGRDHAAINIEKMSQLERNVNEDFHKDEVNEYAKGVLFGNPQRLTAPGERTLNFTEKCFQSAKRNNFALVLTHTMFAPAAYLESTPDEGYAARCRAAILDADGTIVAFPAPPQAQATTVEDAEASS